MKADWRRFSPTKAARRRNAGWTKWARAREARTREPARARMMFSVSMGAWGGGGCERVRVRMCFSWCAGRDVAPEHVAVTAASAWPFIHSLTISLSSNIMGGKQNMTTTSSRGALDPRRMSEEALELVAARFRALGEPSRLKLARAVMDGEKAAGVLAGEAGLGQANASRHLQVLVDAGLLRRRKEGLMVYYGLADPALPELCKVVCDMVQRGHERVSHALGASGGQESPSQRAKRARKLRS